MASPLLVTKPLDVTRTLRGAPPPGRTIIAPHEYLIPAHQLDVGTVVANETLQRTAKPKQPINVLLAAMDAILPIAYGYQQLPALIANVLFYDNQWVWWVWWCEGPIASIDEVSFNDRVLNSVSKHGMLADVHNYLGGTDNVVDDYLVDAYAAQNPPIAFSETLPGVAHSVIRVRAVEMTEVPRIQAKLQGRKVYDPRDGGQSQGNPSTWAFSNNPALVLADFLGSTSFGPGMSLDWSSVTTVANACDALLGVSPNQEKTRVGDVLIANPASIADWKGTLRTAAGCFILENQGAAKLVADVAGSSAATYSHSGGTIVKISNLKLADSTRLPTVIDVQYTDTTQTPWADNTAPPVYRPGVQEGTTPWRRSTVPMPWIQSRSQANREAIERMNKLWLRGISFAMELFNEGLRHEVGDLITVDYPEHGLNSMLVRCCAIAPTANGNWLVQCQKEDAGAYSSTVQAYPTTPNTQLPIPGEPPQATGLAWVEELYLDALGKVKSRMRATWDDMSGYPYFTGYRIEVYNGATLMGEPTFAQVPTLAWGPVQEGLSYTINIYVMSPIAVSDPATATTIAYGKLAPPGDIPFFQAYESSGEVRFSWVPFVDENNPDTLSTELRYGPRQTATWATATVLDFVAMPAQTYTTRRVPPGDYRFFAKGHDSIRTADFPNGQESANAAVADCVVNGDPGLFVVDTYEFDNPTLTHMVQLPSGSWVTDYGTAMSSIFTANPIGNNYPQVMAYYAGSGDSGLLTESYDFGATYSGSIQVLGASYVDLSGTATIFIEVSLTGQDGSWVQYAGLAAQATLRFARLRFATAGSMRVDALGTLQFMVATLTETGEVMTSADGPVTVTLARLYSQYDTIQTTGDVGDGPANPGVCNIHLSTSALYWQGTDYGPTDYVDQETVPANTFDIKCYDGLNNLIANQVKWLFRGI